MSSPILTLFSNSLVFEQVVSFLTYEEVINLLILIPNWPQLVNDSLDPNTRSRLKKVIKIKNNTCHLKPEPKRFYKPSLDCQTWAESSKLSAPTMIHCGSATLSPTPCQFLYYFIAGHWIGQKFTDKPAIQLLMESFENWQINGTHQFGCHVAQSMSSLTEDFRDILCARVSRVLWTS